MKMIIAVLGIELLPLNVVLLLNFLGDHGFCVTSNYE